MTDNPEQQPSNQQPEATAASFLQQQKQHYLNRISLLESSGLTDLAAKARRELNEILAPEVPIGAKEWLDKFITQDKEMLEVKHSIGLLAKHPDTVLITGPTGTGKELLARALHGDRPADKFFGINCAAISPHLVESILFGHVKGSFTGADKTYTGIFQQANGGTILLDEVGELPPEIQAKLLRLLQERTIMRVGGDTYESINCRIVCATLRNLEDMVDRKEFREDLYWRINTFTFNLTPLLSRVDDIPPITYYVSNDYEKKHNVPNDRKFPCGEVHIKPTELKGNVRSIQQIVRRYHLLKMLP